MPESAVFLRFSLFIALLTGAFPVRAAEREHVDFSYVKEKAQALAAEPYQLPDPMPKVLRDLTYTSYHEIFFDPDQAFWRDEDLPFQLQLFPLGYAFNRPVQINEFTDTHTQRIPFVADLFRYNKSAFARIDDPDLGYAGLKLLYPINRRDKFDEVISHLGASYFRAVGKHQRFGISARGLGIDTGENPEEFPVFKEFWMRKPDVGDFQAHYYALLDSPSVTGAYEFTLEPNVTTTVQVRATLYFRRQPKVVAIAPLTSMFWFGENSPDRPRDFRPEVHDSDGLLLHAGNGEWLWRPLVNETTIRRNVFDGTHVKGFGLLQRDRNFSSYEDLEALYHLRPGVWIVPEGEWGPGEVVLMEWPTSDEIHDNVAAFWKPKDLPTVGEPYDISYNLYWTSDAVAPGQTGYVKSTRIGALSSAPDTYRFVVDFGGKDLEALGSEEPVEASISVDPSLDIQNVTTLRNPYNNTWRCTFELTPTSDAPLELRAYLKLRDQTLTETWSYQWIR